MRITQIDMQPNRIEGDSRFKKMAKNARVSLFFLVLVLVATFVSRAVFIHKIGASFIGLATTIVNIVGFLNLAEMGFASVVAFALYGPIHNRNRAEISAIITVFAYIYRRVGFVVMIVGIVGGIFIPHFFRSSGFSTGTIVSTYYIYLFATIIGYFFNYREILLVADQKNYVKVSIFNSLKLAKLGAQVVAVLYLDRKIFWWLGLELVSLVAYAYLLNAKISQVYPWLDVDVRSGKNLSRDYLIIYKKSKQAFVHKLAAVALQQTGPIFVFVFLNLQVVTKYTNYTIIITALTSVIAALFDSTNAGVGNLVAARNSKRTLGVYWELQVSRFWLAGVAAYTLFSTVDLFIGAWVGEAYVLPKPVITVLAVGFFITVVRKTTDEFISASGLYHDTAAPLAEAAINISVTMVLGKMYGVFGIAMGSVISLLIIVGLWKPIFLHNEALGGNVRIYFVKTGGFLLILIFSAFLTTKIGVLRFESQRMLDFVSVSIQRCAVFGTISLFLFFILCVDMRILGRRFRRHVSLKRG
ncbi:hypothetical protein PQR72_06910 [Paraburkholderia madseniana]|uniref:lipopolysaccharide biosynthesis protein n=1 Tax=Paraburkholderia madseniana TaxID=2599607 RepID=UPI0015C52F4F|nr:hypothetical protein [Paraburkholderia madseniana]NPT64415.1 hypothetical protein [Paraburkholderia madseniana]